MRPAPRAVPHLRRMAVACACAILAVASLGGCRKPRYDTSTPAAALEAMAEMVKGGHPELLAGMIDIEARDITFPDGVTEASAIGDVKRKAGDMLRQLWRVSLKLKQRFPAAVEAEISKGGSWASRGGFGDAFTAIIADPFGWLDANRSRLAAEDLGDGTAAFSLDGKPVLGGTLSMRETKDGWRVSVPTELIRSTGYFPDTREEWAVLAYLMLAVENALNDFELELDSGKLRTLSAAGDRAGRLVAESAAAQAIIFAMMQQKDGAQKPAGPLEVKVGGANVRLGPPTGNVEKDLGNAGDVMRRQAEQ